MDDSGKRMGCMGDWNMRWRLGKRLGLAGVLAIVLVAAVVPTSLFEKGKRPLRDVRASKVWKSEHHPLSAKQCKGCHRGVYRKWKASRHAKAWTNRLFAVAFHHSPYQWCVHCHAPLPEQKAHIRGPWSRKKRRGYGGNRTGSQATSSSKPSVSRETLQQTRGEKALLSEGINCAACHLRGGVLLASKPPSKAAKQAHPKIRWEPKLKRSSFCAGCHQFNFTKKLTDPTRVMQSPAQNTYKAWLQSHAKRKGKTCQSCHMKGGDHTTPGAHNLAFVRRAITPKVLWKSDKMLHITFTSRNVGHPIPTGDPFRRLLLEVCPTPACKVVWWRRLLRKTFVFRNGEWFPHKDSRIPGPTSSATGLWKADVKLPIKAKSVFWRLRYFYAEYQHHQFLLPSDISSVLFAQTLQRYGRPTSRKVGFK